MHGFLIMVISKNKALKENKNKHIFLNFKSINLPDSNNY